MRSAIAFRIGAVAALLVLTSSITACASETTPPAASGAEEAPAEALELLQEALDGPDGKEERVFDTSDDNVITVVEETLASQNAKAEWDGATLRVRVDGSADDVTASSPCLMLQAFLKDGEQAILDYSDGEVRCISR